MDKLVCPCVITQAQMAKMPELANQPQADLSRGLTVIKVAEKYG
jgi:hypothetical protein